MSLQKQKILLVQTPGKLDWVISTKPIPSPKAGELLVKIEATALNPSDWKFPLWNFRIPHFPIVMGSDAAGTVIGTGEGVEEFVKGDRVLFAGNRFTDTGTFAQYGLAPAKIAGKIPPSITTDEAATIPVSVGTAVVALYQQRPLGYGLKPIWEDEGRGAYNGEPFVVFGGTSSIGQSGIQFAKISGFSPIIAVASTANSEYLQSIGATHIIDRSLSPSSLISSIKSITGDNLIKIVFDAVSLPQTQGPAWDVLSPGGGLVLLLPRDEKGIDLKKGEQEGKVLIDQVRGHFLEPNDKLGRGLLNALPELVEKDGFKTNRVEILPNGLAGIPDGLKRLQEDKVSGYKLVARPHETP